jgi:hypothetical protein
MTKGKRKSKKSGGASDVVPVGDAAASTASRDPTPPYAMPIDEITSSLSATPLKESELLRSFDIYISNETVMPEEGIQAARDLYLEVSKQQEILVAKFAVISAQKTVLLNENAKMRQRIAALTDDTTKAMHQKDVLHGLAEQLGRKKEVCNNGNDN